MTSSSEECQEKAALTGSWFHPSQLKDYGHYDASCNLKVCVELCPIEKIQMGHAKHGRADFVCLYMLFFIMLRT